MALSIPAFIAMALAGAGAGYASGQAQRKLKDEHESKLFAQRLLQEGIFNKVMAGETPPLGAVEQAIGKQAAAQVYPLIQSFGQAASTRRQENMNLVRGLTGLDPGAMGVGPGAGAARAGVEPLSPEQQALVAGATGQAPQAAPVAPSFSYAPQAVPPEQAELAVPSQVPSGAAPRVGVGADEVARLTQAITRPMGAARTGNIQVEGIGSFNVDFEAQARSQLFSAATRMGASPRSVQEAAAARGIPLSKEQFEGYAQQFFFKHMPRYVAEVQGKGAATAGVPPTPEQQQTAALRFAYDHGWAPSADIQSLFKNQGEVNTWFLQRAARSQEPMGKVVSVLRQFGVTPDAATIQQATAEQRSRVEGALREASPTLAANPSAFLDELRRRVGPEGLSAQENATADAFAPIGQETTAAMTRRGLVPPLMRDTGPAASARSARVAGAAPGLAQTVHEEEQARKVEQAGKQAQRTTEGGAAGRETSRPLAVVDDPMKLQRYVDPDTLGAPGPMTQGQLDEAVKGKRLFQIKDRQDVEALSQLESYVARYRHNIEVLQPLYQGGGATSFLKSVGVVGVNEPIFGLPIVPGGMLSPELQRRYIRSFIKSGISNEQADAMAKAMVDMNALYNEAPLVLRQLGQRGNVPGHIVTRESRSLPTLTDNSVTVQQKLTAFESMVNGVRKGIGLPERISVIAPDGTPGVWDTRFGPVPQGYKRR